MSTESTASISEEPSTSSKAAAVAVAAAAASASSSTTTSNSESQEKNLARYRSLILTECGFTATTNENYLKRLQNLRSELNYITETEWMYEPLEKKPTQY